jgi:hypothetical protein
MNPLKLSALAFLATFGLAAAADDSAGTLPPASTKQGVTYATDIKPILDTSCVKCHSGDKPKAKLKLDSLDDILKGGRDVKVVVAGDSASSLIVQAAAHTTTDHDQWMPPKKAEDKFPPLTPDQIGLIRAWIDQGAK